MSLDKVAKVKSVAWSRMGFNSEVIFNKTLGNPHLDKYKSVELFKSPREVKKISLDPSEAISRLLLREDVADKVVYADLLWVDLRNDKHLCHYCVTDVAFTHNFHGIDALSLTKDTLCYYLNSTLACLFIETIGRGNLGEGAIRILANDLARHFPTLNSEIPFHDISFLKREQFSLFTELGFDRTLLIRDQTPNPLPDRKILDDLIFDALDLTTNERREVYWAVGELVKHRLDKAASR